METFLRSEYTRLGSSLFVSNLVLDRVPHFFNGDLEAYNTWRQKVAKLLEVDLGNVLVVGSGSVGCSLNPSKGFAAFRPESDIDIAVISTYHFDVSWRSLRKLRRADTADSSQWQAVKKHQTTLIYWGCIATDMILELLPFSEVWLRAALEISGYPEIEGKEVNFRIYRDFSSLRSYHENGAKAVLG